MTDRDRPQDALTGAFSVGIYVHVPFCARKCAYCDFPSYAGRERDFERYRRAILRELALRGPLPAVDTVFFGGGTPSLPPPDFVPSILAAIRDGAALAPGAEISCEANPGTLSEAHVAAWKAAGVNRLSLGAQAAQPHLLDALGRMHRWQQVARSAALWEGHFSLDLMYGLPGQTEGDWLDTLQAAIDLRPGHISCYSLIVEQGTPLHARVASGALRLPGDEQERAMYAHAQRILGRQGYRQYEISNWAKPGRACRHNQNTWLRRNYIGLGCAAASFLGQVRSRNAVGLDEYMDSVERGILPIEEEVVLSRQDALFEELMLGLRLTQGVRLSQGALAEYGDRLRALADRGLLTMDGERAALTARGLDIMNAVLVELMP